MCTPDDARQKPRNDGSEVRPWEEASVLGLLLGTIVWLADGRSLKAVHAFSGPLAEETIRAAVAHGLAPVLYSALKASGVDASTLYPELRRAYLVQAARSALALFYTKELATAFDRQGVPLLMLKGGDTGLTLYRDPAHRQLSDLDIMVRPEDSDQAMAILYAMGYRKQVSAFSAEEEWLQLRYLGGIGFVKDGRVLVELHSSFLRGYGEPDAAVADTWRDRISIELDGCPIGTLVPEHAFLNAALHLYGNCERVTPLLKDAADLLLLARRIEKNGKWDSVWAAAERWHIVREVSTVCHFLNKALDARVPAVPPNVPGIEPRAFMVLPDASGRRSRLVEGALLRLRMMRYLPGLSRKVRYLAGFAFPRAEYLRTRYRWPEERSLLPCYGVHLAWAVRRLGADVIRLLLRRPR